MANTALQIRSTAVGASLTPEQKRFNSLIRQIEQARKRLLAWQDGIPACHLAYSLQERQRHC